MIKKIILLVILISALSITYVYALDINSVADEIDLNSLIDTLKEYIPEDIDVDKMSQDLLTGNGIDYGVIGNFILNKLFYEIRLGLKTCISIIIVIIIMAIVKGIELEKDNTLSKVTNLVGFLIIVTTILKSYFVILDLFTQTIMLFTQIVEIVAPFMMALLITTGEIVTSGIIGPLLLFVTSLIGVIVSYVIVPLLTLSLVFKIISNMSEKIKLESISNIFSSGAMWTVGIIFTVFLGIVELEGSVTTSIDQVTVKTTQVAVSNLVPVVGKFVSDSLEVVMGASEVIVKSVGVIASIILIIIAIVPIIKIAIFSFIHFVLSAISQLLNVDNKITNLCESMSKQYKTMLGIMIGVMLTFIIGIGVIIKLIGKVAG